MTRPRIRRFFRAAADLDLAPEDWERYQEFVYDKLFDLLVRAQATAWANDRGVIEPHDLPITSGLQECVNDFRDLGDFGEGLTLEPIMDSLATRPPLDARLSAQTEARIVPIVGGISVALALTFRIMDPAVRHPTPEHWERASRIIHLLL